LKALRLTLRGLRREWERRARGECTVALDELEGHDEVTFVAGEFKFWDFRMRRISIGTSSMP
jgi:hypothetical protein